MNRRRHLNLLKNKHVLTAAIVTPILALVSYFAVDFIAGEKPHAAEKGQSYRLVEKPNCRYDSGRCGLKNGDFELELVVEDPAGNRPVLKLSSVHPLDGVMVALLEDEENEKTPMEMISQGDGGLAWSIELEPFDPGHDRLRLAASARDALYFGDAALKFAMEE
jgi:hypothetical protein